VLEGAEVAAGVQLEEAAGVAVAEAEAAEEVAEEE